MAMRKFTGKSAIMPSGDVGQTPPSVEDAARAGPTTEIWGAVRRYTSQISGKRVTSPSAKRAKRNGRRSTIGVSPTANWAMR
jgi:hypothetical protein